jgi:hypothetical protein
MHYGFIVDTVNKMYSKSLSSDVANDISIRLLSFDNDKLNKLHNDKEIQKYIYSVIRNERYNPRSASNKTYCERMVFNESVENDNVDISSLISILTPYELKLITIYSQTNNIAEISRKYKIRRSTIHKDVKFIQQKIKQSIK